MGDLSKLDPIELPCGDTVRAKDVVGEHLGGQRMIECAVHGRKFIIGINVRQIVEFEIKEAP